MEQLKFVVTSWSRSSLKTETDAYCHLCSVADIVLLKRYVNLKRYGRPNVKIKLTEKRWEIFKALSIITIMLLRAKTKLTRTGCFNWYF